MKIGIVGIGRVGATLAYTLVLQHVGSGLVLVNRRPEIAEAEAADLGHAAALGDRPMGITAGGASDLAGCGVVLFAASAPMTADMAGNRNALLHANAQVLRDQLPAIAAACPDTVLVMLSNPVDVLTRYAIELTGFPPTRVIGSGTLIDSARYRALVAADTGIHPSDLRAYILGEHGPTQFPALSIAMAGGERADDPVRQGVLFDRAVESAHDVFRRKGYTNFAVARAAAMVVRSIVDDLRHTLPVSVRIDGFAGVRDVCLSLPCVIGAGGVRRVLHPALDEEDRAKFVASADAVRAVYEQLG